MQQSYSTSHRYSEQQSFNSKYASNATTPNRKVQVIFRNEKPECHCSGVESVAVNEEGSRAFTASRDSTVKSWSITHERSGLCSVEFQQNYEQHTDWVTDIVVNKNQLYSCSQDNTVKAWSTLIQESVSPVVIKNFGRYSDYLLKLAIARQKQYLACVGLSGQFYLYDLQNLAQCADFSDRWEKGSKPSLYSVAVNEDCSFMAAGLHDGTVQIFDQRDRRRNIVHLRGHMGCVRDILVSRDTRLCATASSDKTIRVWDLGQSRCIAVYHTHSDSVHTLDASDDFDLIYSGGRDKCVFATNLQRHVSDLILMEKQPIRKLRLGPAGSNTLWVTTTNPQVHLWPSHIQDEEHTTIQRLGSRSASRLFQISEWNPLYVKPLARTPGMPGIVQQHTLNNKRQILLKYSDENVGVWDVTFGKEVQNFGKANFEQKIKHLNEEVVVESWFKSEHKLGVLSFELEYPTCFKAEVYGDKLGYNVSAERKLNLGAMMLEGLFNIWIERFRQLRTPQHIEGESEEEEGDGSSTVDYNHSIPRDHWGLGEKTPLPFMYGDHGVSASVSSLTNMGEPWLRQIWEFTGRETSPEIIPNWVYELVINGNLPQNLDLKLSFYIRPLEGSGLPDIASQKLVAPKILQVSKVGKYIADTLKNTNTFVAIVWIDKKGEQQVQEQQQQGGDQKAGDQARLLQISCKGKSLEPSINLATIKRYIWKESSDLVLEYAEFKQTQKNSKK